MGLPSKEPTPSNVPAIYEFCASGESAMLTLESAKVPPKLFAHTYVFDGGKPTRTLY